jgi:hypothetical protein
MRPSLLLILTLSFGLSYGQGFSYPSINKGGQTISDFVPTGWTILDSIKGDLNKDYIDDAVIILQHKDSVMLANAEGDTTQTQPRVLLILFKNTVSNNFELIEQSNSFILKHDNSAMEDPYESLAINKEVLEISFNIFYNMGSWYVTNATYKFRYQQGQFVLIGAENSSFHRSTHDYENYSYNFLAKKRSLTKGNDNKGAEKTTWKTVKIPTLKTLKTFAEPFTWEVEKDIYL